MHGKTIAGLTGLLLLAACGGESPPAQDNEAAPANVAAAPAENGVVPAAIPPAEAAAGSLVLEGHGLRIVEGGASEMVPFDTSKAAAIAALTKALGRPPSESGSNSECGGGGLDFAQWEGQLTAWFESERLVGWDNKGALKTGGGIGVGSRRADLASLNGLEVEETSLGTEFRAGGLSGLLDSKAPDAKVTHLWGGATCSFR